MTHIRRELIFYLLSFCFLSQCSRSPESEIGASKKNIDLNREEELYMYNSTSNEIPKNIREIENINVFPVDAEPSHSIKLIPIHKYGDTEEPYIGFVLRAIEDINGKLIIWTVNSSNYKQSVYIFHSDGTFYKNLGRNGRGPGEYLHISRIHAKNDKIYVQDGTNKWLNEYSTTDYSFVKTIRFETWKSSRDLNFAFVEPRMDGNFFTAFMDFGPRFGRTNVEYQIMDSTGNTLNDEPIILPDAFKIDAETSFQPKMPLGFMGGSITSLTTEDEIYYINTHDFLIKKFDQKGEYQSSIYYPIERLPLDLDGYVKKQLFSHDSRDIKKAFASMNLELPKEFSGVERMVVDDENRIWVALLNGSNSEYYQWWILKKTGELLAKLKLPREQQIYDIKNGYLYSKKKNEETDDEYVVKYKIELTERHTKELVK